MPGRSSAGSLVAAIGRRPRLTALLGAFCIAFSGVFYRLAETTPETAAVFRSLYGLPLLVLVAAFERRRVGSMPRRGQWLAVFAGALFAADLIFWHHAIDAVGAGLATVLGNLQVVFVALAAWLLLGIVLIGGVLESLLGGRTYGTDPPLGVLLGVLTAIAYAGYLIVIRQVGRGRMAEPVAISTASTAVVCALVGIGLGTFDPLPSWPAHGWLAALGVSAQSAGYLLIMFSLPRLPAVATSMILLAQPVMAVFFAGLILAEAPSFGLAGVGLVIGGIALATLPLRGLGRALRRRAPPSP